MAAKEKDYTGTEFVIIREFSAPRELVFKAWTDPKQLAQWWGPRGFANPVCEWDVRPGGKIYDVMRSPDGVEYPMGGEFREIVPPEKLSFVCGALDDKGKMIFEFLHDATFTEKDSKTKLVLRSRVLRTTADANKYIGGFEMGMTLSLERLDELLTSKDREIFISREFNAPRELLWEAMTNPKHVVNWWGPQGFTTTIETMDFRVGGDWIHVMRGPDGVEYPNHSVFKEIVKPEKIVYSNGGGKKGGRGVQFVSTWTFEDLAKNKTRVSIRMVFPTADDRDFVVREHKAIEGGKQTLGRLEEYVRKL
ncbi:MAG TPA: SRPBCC domain-containing protein [Candidatus Sulfotelmatobacter sp.]|nr:SRPBCC domain-containing protein [Candidatus Sulfotelmatobacter sp.]